MKQNIMTLLLMTAFTALFVACNTIDNSLPDWIDREIVIDGPGVVKGSLKMWPGERIPLMGDIQPHYTKEGPIEWYSSVESVVKVDAQTGELIALKPGTAIITAIELREDVWGKGQITVTVMGDPEVTPDKPDEPDEPDEPVIEPLGEDELPVVDDDEVSQGLAEAPRL